MTKATDPLNPTSLKAYRLADEELVRRIAEYRKQAGLPPAEYWTGNNPEPFFSREWGPADKKGMKDYEKGIVPDDD